jgi:hypothetical protein
MINQAAVKKLLPCYVPTQSIIEFYTLEIEIFRIAKIIHSPRAINIIAWVESARVIDISGSDVIDLGAKSKTKRN